MTITTLIPAYNTAYLVDLLNALRLQTLRADRIVVSDDSPHGEFRETLFSAPYAALRAGLPIECIEGPRNGAYENLKQLVRVAAGSTGLVHVMLDDDVVYPSFYERHRVAHASGDFACVVSRRWSAGESGFPTATQPVPAIVADAPNRMVSLTDALIFQTAVVPCSNWFGEFSNATFRAEAVELLLTPALGDVSYAGLWDLGAFVAASLQRPLALIQDHLGFFRVGPGQNSSNLNGPMMKAAHLGYVALAIGGRRLGRIDASQVARCAAAVSQAIAARYSDQADITPFRALLPALVAGEHEAEQRFVEAWHAFQATHGF